MSSKFAQTFISPTILIISNLSILYGVLFQGWDVFQILFLYWLESGAIGFINIFKIFLAEGKVNQDEIIKKDLNKIGLNERALKQYVFVQSMFISKPGVIIVFCIHFSFFMIAHLIFLVTFFKPKLTGAFINYVFPVLIVFLVSHTLSFFINYIGRGEYKVADFVKQSKAPYFRIVIMHLVIISSGFIVQFLDKGKFAILVLVLLKIGVDLYSHLKEHSTFINKLNMLSKSLDQQIPSSSST